MFSSLAQALAIDYTFFIQFAIFFLFYPVFSRFLFYPYFQLQNQREQETGERMKQVEKWKTKKQVLQEQYEQKACDLNEDFNKLYNKGSVQIKEVFLENKIKIQKGIQTEYVQKREALMKDIEEAGMNLQADINQLTKAAVNRLVS